METPNTVLIVDDETFMRHYLTKVLQVLGVHQVLEAKDADEAMDLYQREVPDLVLMDVNMPGKNGLQTLKEMKRQHPHARVIMMTCISKREVVQACVAAGASNYLLKSESPERTLELLKQAIAKI